MKYNLKGKEINIPDEEIDNLVDTLELSIDEAIQTWLEDNDYEVNEEVERLTKLAKENKSVKHDARSDKPRAKRNVVKKENPTKEGLIKLLAAALGNEGIAAQITNPTKIIEFDLNGEHFKLDLIQQRKKK